MQKITYKFNDGTTKEIEVTDEFYTIYHELIMQEKRNHWRETRRHISLNQLNDLGIDLSNNVDVIALTIKRQDQQRRLKNIFAQFSKKQQKLIYLIYVKQLTYEVIAKQLGVTFQAVAKQHKTIRHKFQKLFLKKG